MTTPPTIARARAPWMPDEAERLQRLAVLHTIPQIAEQLQRTERAIQRRLTRQHTRVTRRNWAHVELSIRDVMQAFGAKRTTVDFWMSAGNLAYTPAPPPHPRSVSIANLVAFLEAGGALLAVLKPSPMWAATVRDIRAELLQRLVRGNVLFASLAITQPTFWRWQHCFGFPGPFCYVERGGTYYDKAAVAAWLDANPGRFGRWTSAARKLLCEVAE